jgi:hypothetical protein
MAEEYYKKHPAQFELPETVKAEVVVFNPDVVEDRIIVSDADIKAYYDQNLARYKTDEQRRASHILIAAGKDASAADKVAAKAKADKVVSDYKNNFTLPTPYLTYQQPNFKVRCGDFRTRAEARKYVKSISAYFPSAFIVKDFIEVEQ